MTIINYRELYVHDYRLIIFVFPAQSEHDKEKTLVNDPLRDDELRLPGILPVRKPTVVTSRCSEYIPEAVSENGTMNAFRRYTCPPSDIYGRIPSIPFPSSRALRSSFSECWLKEKSALA